MTLTVQALDHLVVQVSDLEVSAQWYGRVLGMSREDVAHGDGQPPRTEMKFGRQKINLRPIAASKEDWFTADHEAVGQRGPLLSHRFDAGRGRSSFAGSRRRHRGRPRTETGRPGNADVGLLPRSGRRSHRDRLVPRWLVNRFKSRRYPPSAAVLLEMMHSRARQEETGRALTSLLRPLTPARRNRTRALAFMRRVRGGYAGPWRRTDMPGNLIYYALVLIVIALVAALLGFGGVAGTAMSGAHLLIWLAVVIVIVGVVFALIRRA
jgi:uncharacterized membrane protein YtjA (UPF0391 family)/catechol 2,3-dioxygenase-like lactoylglutathione lyase family enzyme